jgi:hypothetical protein
MVQAVLSRLRIGLLKMYCTAAFDAWAEARRLLTFSIYRLAA